MKFLVKSMVIGSVMFHFLTPRLALSHDTSQELGNYFFFKTCEIAKNDMKKHLDLMDSLLKEYDKLVLTSTTKEMLLGVGLIENHVVSTASELNIINQAFIDKKLAHILLNEKLYPLYSLAIDLALETSRLFKNFRVKVGQDNSYKYNTMLLVQARQKMAQYIKTLEDLLSQK